MTTMRKLLGDTTALADYLDQRLTCVCDDRLDSLASGAELLQTLVDLHLLVGTFEGNTTYLAYTVIVQPEYLQDEGVSAELAARRSLEISRLLATGSESARHCPTYTALVRRKLSRSFLVQASRTLGFDGTLVDPSPSAIRLAGLITAMLNPGRPMKEEEFFRALGFCLAWTNYCNVQMRSLERFLRAKCVVLVSDLDGHIVSTFYGKAPALSWINDTIKLNEQSFVGTAKAVLLLFDYYVGTTETDILSYWLMAGMKDFEAVHENCAEA